MTYELKRLSCNPAKLKGLSEKLTMKTTIASVRRFCGSKPIWRSSHAL